MLEVIAVGMFGILIGLFLGIMISAIAVGSWENMREEDEDGEKR